jgi:hypothetical protein
MPCIGTDILIGEAAPCHYCKRTMLPRVNVPQIRTRAHPLTPTRDHVHPRPQRKNMPDRTGWVWACYECNHIKGCRTEQEWLRFMRENPNWWGLPSTRKKGPFNVKTVRLSSRPDLANVDWTRPEGVPVVYDDPKQQKAFERVYKNRLYMLRERVEALETGN